MFQPGPIVDTRGRRLGTHGGLPSYTIGQRKGLGLATGRALHVVDVDARTNTLTVGEPADLERTRLVARAVNFIACEPPREPIRVDARIRHNHTPSPASVRALSDGSAEVVFDAPQRAVTPGQSVVWYRGDCVVGGGVISR
jgi:tRNA-uridine 2-sulfurtransferase